MNKNLKLILSSFTKQANPNGCGAACLETIFKYSGIDIKLPAEVHEQSLSMRQLQELAIGVGLPPRAVRMDLEHLRQLNTPSILHVLTEAGDQHYIVCFGYDAELDLIMIGDPDALVCYISKNELSSRWQSRAAIIFESLPEKKNWRIRLFPWNQLFHFKFVPGILWIAIPLLNLFASVTGLGAMLIIEKAINPQFLDGRTYLTVVIFGLLLFLSLAKGSIGYVKEMLILNFAGKMDTNLYLAWIAPFQRPIWSTRLLTRHYADAIKDVQRVHQSVSILVGGVLSDALMLAILLACLYFYFPVLVILEILIILLLVCLTDRQLPFMLINYSSGQTAALSVAKSDRRNQEDERESLISCGIEANSTFSRKARKLSTNASKLNLWFDGIGSINILMVLAYTLYQLHSSAASYQEFIFGIILCYSLTGLATKICNQLFLVAQGAEMLSHRNKIR